jgi:hypothetical protein
VANGDAWLVSWHEGACRVAVIDGLGHGPAAAAAAAAAVGALREAPHLDPVAALLACDRALAGTRGAAISVAWLGPSRRLVYAGVGNVEARLWQPDREQRPVARRGIVGAAAPRGRPSEFALGAEWWLVVHTDGVSARFRLGELPEFGRRDPQGLADALVARWGRQADDATAVVVRPA